MKIVNQAMSLALTAGIGAVLGAGCGGNSSGSPADTGLPPAKLLRDVTAEEATQACEKVQSSIERRYNQDTIIEAFCTMGAALNATTASSCGNLRDACIEEASQPGSVAMMELDIGTIDLNCEMQGFEQCSADATVGELETCLDDTFDALDALLNRFDCSDAGTVTEADLENTTAEPSASCEAVSCGGEGPFGG